MDLLLQAERDRALAILANVGPRGYPRWGLLNEHGFTPRTLTSLVDDGLAAEVSEPIVQMQITEARVCRAGLSRRPADNHGDARTAAPSDK
jgi:hypothetical protein